MVIKECKIAETHLNTKIQDYENSKTNVGDNQDCIFYNHDDAHIPICGNCYNGSNHIRKCENLYTN